MLGPLLRSLRYKFLLSVMAAACGALVVAGLVLAFNETRNYRDAWIADLTAQAQILGRSSAAALAFDDPATLRGNLDLLKLRPAIAAAAVYDAKGRMVARYQAADAGAWPLPKLPESDGLSIDGDRIEIFSRVIEQQEIVGSIYLRGHYRLNERLRDFTGILLAVLALSLLVAALISTWVQKALTQPVLAVAEAARQVVQRQDYSMRVAKTTDDEVGQLVDTFNKMLAELGRRDEAIGEASRSLELEVAERRRADNDLRQLNEELEGRVAQRTQQLEQANKELESFSYSVSHDLRAPLRGVVGFAEALVEDHAEELSGEALRKLRIVQNEARRMGQLIDDLLDFSRLGRKAFQLGDVDMRALALSTWQTLLQQQPDAVRVELQLDQLPAVVGDRSLLGQVWVNLLSNAIKFTGKQERPHVTVSSISDGKEHIYYVRDNGAGFDEKYQAKLFGVFQRLHHQNEFPGTGVGLALVQRIVQRHGGRVWAEGQPGQGATFYFSLPREAHEPVV